MDIATNCTELTKFMQKTLQAFWKATINLNCWTKYFDKRALEKLNIFLRMEFKNYDFSGADIKQYCALLNERTILSKLMKPFYDSKINYIIGRR